MSDISKCKQEACPLKTKCYRYLAKANPYWQSYLQIELTEEIKQSKCDYYMHTNEMERATLLKEDL